MASSFLGIFCSRVSLTLTPLKPSLSRPCPSPSRHLSVSASRLSHIGSKPISIPADVSVAIYNPIRPRSSSSASPHGAPQVRVTGKLGKLEIDLLPYVSLNFEGPQKTRVLGADLPPTPLVSPAAIGNKNVPEIPSDSVSGAGVLKVTVEDENAKRQRGGWGLMRALVANAVTGVTEGFTSSLDLVGVGYRASLEDVPPHPGSPPDAQPKRQRLNLRVGYSHPVLIDVPDTDTFLSCEVPMPNRIVLKGIDKQELGLLAAGIRKWRPPEPYNGKGIYLNGEVIKRKESKKK